MVIIMNIRSIDLQVLIPRTTDVAKSQAVNDRQGMQQQQQFAEQFQKITTELQHQVQSTAKSTGSKIERDGHRNRQNPQDSHPGKDKTFQQEEQAENAVDQPDPIRGHNIDIVT